MKTNARAFWAGCLLAVTCLAAGAGAQAAGQELNEPQQVVQEVTDQLIGAARQFNDSGDKAAFDETVMDALEPVVAFDYIARVVMGDYFKDASSEQRRAFADKLKADLVSTYAKGIATYANSDIRLKPADPVGDARRVSIEQQVTYEGENHRLVYTMGKNSSGEWKLINLILNGVNLGRSLSSQFQQLAGKHDGNFDEIIAHWDAESA